MHSASEIQRRNIYSTQKKEGDAVTTQYVHLIHIYMRRAFGGSPVTCWPGSTASAKRLRAAGSQAQLLDARLAHDELLHFARHGERERLFEHPIARHLEIGQLLEEWRVRRALPSDFDLADYPLFAELLQLVGDDLGAGLGPDPGAHFLAEAGIGHSDDLRERKRALRLHFEWRFNSLIRQYLDVLHFGVRVKNLLDLSRVNVLAASDDHLLDPADDLHVSILVENGHVTGYQRRALSSHLMAIDSHVDLPGAEPALLRDGIGGGLRVVPVAEHRARAPRPNFAGRADGDELVRVRVDDFHLEEEELAINSASSERLDAQLTSWCSSGRPTVAQRLSKLSSDILRNVHGLVSVMPNASCTRQTSVSAS